MVEAQEWLYRDVRSQLEQAGCFISDDVDERLVELVEVVLGDPANAGVHDPCQKRAAEAIDRALSTMKRDTLRQLIKLIDEQFTREVRDAIPEWYDIRERVGKLLNPQGG